MPTYEYECDACGHRFERFQSISDKPVRTCPECKRRKVRRLIGAGAAVIFKGSGFYQTDYRSAEYKRRSKEENSSGTTKTDASTKAKGSENKAK